MDERSKLSNFIPISRDIFKHHLWDEKRIFSKFEAWLFLLQEAKFEDSKILDSKSNSFIIIKRGDVYASFRFMADYFKWSTTKVANFIELLESDSMVKKKTHEKTGQTVVTICNYDVYNVGCSYEKDSQKDAEKTQKRRRKDAEKTNYNIENKENKDNSINLNEKLLTFVDFDWKDLLNIWLDYKRTKGQTYKSDKTVKVLFDKLVRDSYNNLETATLMIENSIANNYSGIFKLKGNENKRNNRQEQTTEERISFARSIAEGIERGYKNRERT